MKRFVQLLTIILFFTHTICFADSHNSPLIQDNLKEQTPVSANLEEAGASQEFIAEQKVKMLPSKHGATIDSYMTNMSKIPMAEDLGWKVTAIEDGYEVERSLLMNNSKTLRYKWKVSNAGEVSPLNDRARSLMKN